MFDVSELMLPQQNTAGDNEIGHHFQFGSGGVGLHITPSKLPMPTRDSKWSWDGGGKNANGVFCH